MSSTPSHRWRRCAAVAATVALSLAVASCSGDDEKQDADAGASPTEVLALAQKTLDETSGVQITLATDDLPGGVTGITSATGVGTHPPAFEGSFKLSVNGLPADADVIAVDEKTYAKNSLLLPDWTEIDPSTYGAPDPNDLLSPDSGFSALLGATTGLAEGESVRGGKDNKEVLTEYTGKVPGKAVESIIPSAAGDFDVTYTITDAGELRQAVVTGVFYEGADPLTYTIGLDDYGTEQDITAP